MLQKFCVLQYYDLIFKRNIMLKIFQKKTICLNKKKIKKEEISNLFFSKLLPLILSNI